MTSQYAAPMSRRTAMTATATVGGALTLFATSCSSEGGGGSDQNSLTITSNAIVGGKNAESAEWIENYVIPGFIAQQKENGRDVQVTFEPQGVDDEDYKTKVSLDLNSGRGADVISIDGTWVGEFAQAGYIKPLTEVADGVEDWDGWDQINEAVRNSAAFDGDIYGVPDGTNGRVWYFNRDLFRQAGLSEDWQPASWDELLEAGRALKELDDVVPIQLNAGTAMGEATTMQGLLPILAGVGEEVWVDGTWLGNTEGMREALSLYRTIYIDEELGDPVLQQEANGRDASFEEFSQGRIGILLEGDYFWRAVVNPAEGAGTAPMEDRDEVVGFAKIPAREPGAGVNGQDFVSFSGAGCQVLNPNAADPDLAWQLIEFMTSAEAIKERTKNTVSITQRDDVNAENLGGDPLLSMIAQEVLPTSLYRPSLAEYPEISVALQQATLDVVSGVPVEEAAQTYADTVAGIVGDENVSSS
ncbi:extracellular solute-binding protein [Brachybacterium sp. p3-SID957]|uniref:extracellular solute-binding protein n=1 Tax=Brachybacterium sp. p3-SID957 TaxID=2916049 RepID=UPI00223C4959|nr:extracellular solute-binding protein [Brachybacterium sp. p3-SID957]MCT1776737.1 extracellular solute-binding protein [Brachybacterium sp. p3-SID957]